MLPRPTKRGAGLTLGTLTALGCEYKCAKEDVLCGGHAVIRVPFMLFRERKEGGMEGAPGRGRNRLVSGAAEARAAAAGGTQRALVSGLRAAGDRDTRTARAGPGPAPVPCPRPAPSRPRTVQAGKKKRKSC